MIIDKVTRALGIDLLTKIKKKTRSYKIAVDMCVCMNYYDRLNNSSITCNSLYRGETCMGIKMFQNKIEKKQ